MAVGNYSRKVRAHLGGHKVVLNFGWAHVVAASTQSVNPHGVTLTTWAGMCGRVGYLMGTPVAFTDPWDRYDRMWCRKCV